MDSVSMASDVLSHGVCQVCGACVRGHCISGFMGPLGRECGGKPGEAMPCVSSLNAPCCVFCAFPTVHTQWQESGGGCEAGDGREDRGAPGGLLQP